MLSVPGKRLIAGLLFLSMTIVVKVYSAQVVTNSVGKVMPADAASLDRQTYRFLLQEPTTLDISIAVYQAGGAVFSFEGLTRLDENNELTAAAAKSWEVSDDGLQWTFHLRRGAKWSDGRAVTAHDFVYTYVRIVEPASGNVNASFYYDIKGAQAFNQGKLKDVAKLGLEAIDDYTFVITTERPCPYIPLIASFPTSGPVPSWQVEKYGPKWTEDGNCVSNSTFKLDSWLHGTKFEFVLDPLYNGPHKAYLERIVGLFTNTDLMAGGTLAYENNEVDYQLLSPVDLPRIRSHPQLRHELDISPDFETNYLFFDPNVAPFGDVRVRRAIAHAIDRDLICRIVLQGMAEPAYSMLPPGFPGYSDGKYDHLQRFDVKRARELLAEAGFANGRGFPRQELWINRIDNQITAQALQQMLKQNLNINLDIRVVERSAYRQAQFQWQIPMSLIQYHYDYPDPNNMLSMVWHSQPKGYSRHPWANKSFDDLVDEAASEMDPVRRNELYQQAEKILSEDAGAAFIYYDKIASLRKPWIKGIKRDRDGFFPFWGNNTGYMDVYIGSNIE